MNAPTVSTRPLHQRIDRILAIGDWVANTLESSLNRFGWLWAIVLTIVYMLCVAGQGRLKPLWFDEVFTTYIARLDGPRAIWNALARGVDLNPPGIYIATRTLEQWAGGEGPISTRLPEMIGYWLMSVCLFRFVQYRCGRLYGLLAALLPIGTLAATYAVEARPYAVIIGLCGLGLVAWQAAAEGTLRILTVPLLALSLAAAISFHYYAALLFLAFGTGELVRTVRLRKIDLPVWIAILAGALPMVAYFPLIQGVRSYFRGFFVKPDQITIESLYGDLFLTGWVLVAIMLLLCTRALEGESRCKDQSGKGRVPAEEVAIAVVLVLLPTICWVVSKLAVGQILVRYALSVVIGGSALAAYMLYSWRFRKIYATLVILLLLSIFCKRGLTGALTIRHHKEAKPEYIDMVEATPGTLPIVFFRCTENVEASFYLKPDVARRTRCLADVDAAFRSNGVDNLDRATLALRPFAPNLNVDEFGPFVAKEPQFYIIGKVSSPWLLEELKKKGAKVELVKQMGSTLWVLLLAQMPAAPK